MCVLVCESECVLLYICVCVCVYLLVFAYNNFTFNNFWLFLMSQQQLRQQLQQRQRQRQQHLNCQAAAVWQPAGGGRGVAEGRGCYSYRSKIKLVISFSRTASGRNMARLQPKQQYPLCLRLCLPPCLPGTDFGLGLHALWALAMAFCFDCGSVRPQCKPPAPPLSAVSLPLIGFALHLQAAVAA